MNALLKKSIAEFVGVTVFLTAITAGANNGLKPFTVALALGLMILLTGGVSGGHLNPAVSLFFYARKEITLGNLLAYIAAQLAGAFAGASLGALLTGTTNKSFVATGGSIATMAIASEVVATAGLVWIIGTLVQNKLGNLIPVAVAAWIVTAASFTSTGAQANPAVTFGLMVQGSWPTNFGSALIVAQIGGVLLAILLLMLFAPKAKKTATKKKN
ncbi:MAG: aquaporin [Micrococcales bacterium]